MANSIYGKKDAVIMQGFAVITMLTLHLFCRDANSGLYGTHLLWINETTPLAYWFGFFAEICMPLFTCCAGYARWLMIEQSCDGLKTRGKRVWKLLVNFWIVVLLVCLLGLIADPGGSIPGSPKEVVLNLLLVDKYTGIWWYLATYIFLTLLPACVVLAPLRWRHGHTPVVLAISFSLCVVIYAAGKFTPVASFTPDVFPLSFIWTQIYNLIKVLPYYWLGAIVCKSSLMDCIGRKIRNSFGERLSNLLVVAMYLTTFVLFNLIHLSILVWFVTGIMFISLPLVRMPDCLRSLLGFLGKHSTNIWLWHGIFYLELLTDIVLLPVYPLPILLWLFVLCIAASYVTMGVQKGVMFVSGRIAAIFRGGQNDNPR